MEYRISPLSPAHLPEVDNIEVLCFEDPWSPRLLEEAVTGQNALCLGAFSPAGELAGYLLAAYVLDEGCVDNVAVRPELRRQGIASLLLEALAGMARARGLAFLTLEVRASNLPAQRLYEKQGYRPVGRRKNYYSHPREDAILMTLELRNETEDPDA